MAHLNFLQSVNVVVATWILGNVLEFACLENRNAWRIYQQLTSVLETTGGRVV